MSGRDNDNLVDHFRSVFAAQPEQRIFRFLVDGEGTPLSLTNAELDLRARTLAATLLRRVSPGDRALIVCPSGLDYVASFLGCLYSGVIAVPVYPPDPALLHRTLPRLLGVIEDAEPAVVLAPAATAALAGAFSEHAPALGTLAWIAVDELDPEAAGDWSRPAVTGADLAFLQYTSGSTSRPKGVMVGHANLVHNLGHLNTQFFAADQDSHMVSWLPPYHDMGLIAGLLAPAFGGYPVTFMSPFSFLKRPYRWLRAISDHRGTLAGGPNFCYDLCAARISEEERESLDLSSWRVTLNGAEPVRMETIGRFSARFADNGFRRGVFMPAYGLAEGTLAVAGGSVTADPVARGLRAEALATGEVVDAGPGEDTRTVVGCGWSLADQRIVIADPVSLRGVPEGRVGEIWIAGASVAHGYWRRPETTAEIFDAHLEDTGEGPFLRTGDLGFLDGTELHVTGRIKDVIIIAGRNHYPQDIERTVEAVDRAVLRPGCGIAGTREIDGEERLIVVQEVAVAPDRFDGTRVRAAIQAAVQQEHGLPVYEVVLVERGTVPKTSSGKLQRSACLNAYQAGELTQVAAAGTVPAPETTPVPVRRNRIEALLRTELARLTGGSAEGIDPTVPFAAYGLKSVDLISLTGELERTLGRSIESTVMWEHPTTERLAAFLGGELPEPVDRSSTVDGRDGAAAEPVAIVGIGCRFPGGADGPESFWELLRQGRDAVTEVPAQRWDVAEFSSPDPAAPGRTTSRWGGFLDGVDRFDPHFFGISVQEAARMDPQQRLLAEVAWEALEDAGIPASTLAGTSAGVFVGISSFDYATLQLGDLAGIDAHTGTGSALSIAANRLSYLFDLRGPSMAVDTACSSSLVAVVQALGALARGDCDTALVGGVNLVLSPAFAINFAKAGALAADGRCKPFDSRADGYVRAEGAGMVVLKPLSRALADHDPVYGVIRGGAITQDGRSNGLMAPNPQAQESLLRKAYANAGRSPERVRYVEAHGTGTILGDPIEAKALAAVLTAGREEGPPCLIGSVKSNLGHMEAAAGIGGLIKAALMVHHRMIPASLHYQRPNPHIPFGELGLRVADRLQPWPTAEPALAGVNSFGFGGTNAHVVLEQAPNRSTVDTVDTVDTAGAEETHLLAISARSREALRELAGRYRDRLAWDGAGLDPAALAFASTVRRTHHEHRLACVGGSVTDFADALAAFDRDEEVPGCSSGSRRLGRRAGICFVFSGQGPRWWPLAADLLESEPVFREVIERCDGLLRGHVDWSLLDRLTTGPDGLADTAVGQPALCAVQVALAALWRSWGIEPASVVGHSVGEVAAAHVAGALSLADTLLLSLHRGRALATGTGAGRMAMAGLTLDRARQVLAERGSGAVWVAASNSPHSTVFSGEAAAVRELAASLEADGVYCRVLESVEFASHSPMMEPVAAELRRLLSGLTPRATTIPMISTVTAEPVEGQRLDAEYWAANLSSPVLFDRAITVLAEEGHEVFVELAPHPMLRDSISERLEVQQAGGIAVASLRRDEPGLPALLGELGRLYTAGFELDWTRVHGATGPMVRLPSYPWQRQRCWLDEAALRRRRGAPAGHPVLGAGVRSAVSPHAWHWSSTVDLTGFGYLADHRVGGNPVLPASLLLDAALAGARQISEDTEDTENPESTVLEDVRFTRMTVPVESATWHTLQLVAVPETADSGSFRLFSRGGEPGQDWDEVATGRYRGDTTAPSDTLTGARNRCQSPVEAEGLYAELAAAGLEYGPAFQGLHGLWRGQREAVAQLRDLAALTADPDAYLVHPALLDSCLHTLAAALDGRTGTHLPVAVGGFTLTGAGTAPRWAHAVAGERENAQGEIAGCSVLLYDEAGAPVGALTGITVRRLDRDSGDELDRSLLRLDWQEAGGAEPGPGELGDGWWLLLAHRSAWADSLRGAIEARGGQCVAVTEGQTYQRVDPGHYRLDPADAGDLIRLLAELRDSRGGPCAGVVHAWSLGAPGIPETGTGWATEGLPAISALHLVQALSAQDWDRPPRLLLVTRGAQRLAGDEGAPALAQSPLTGLARVIALEHGELRPVQLDLDPSASSTVDGVTGVLAELLHPSVTAQVALRGGLRHTPELAPLEPAATEAAEPVHRPFDPELDGNHRLLAAQPGILDSLAPVRWVRTPPGPGQVQIEIDAAGLNFSDVLKAMDAYPGAAPGEIPLGAECAGRVCAVGESVERYRIGDRVLAVGSSALAAYLTTDARLVAPAPAALSEDEAAAVPIAFLTAVYGLEHLARLRAGETVLIHSATGGVGRAALQVARSAGARVFATAGTEEKRELLRSLGIEHVLDSRTLEFAERITELTGGRGVDVVLNSVSGAALRRSLELLAPGGRFVEIGKRDIYADSHLGLGLFKHNRSLFAVDLERSIEDQPDLVAELFERVVRGFEEGEFTALPVTGYPYTEAATAFARMAQARHQGKLVLRPESGQRIALPASGPPVHAAATYLITGGLGALGLETARYLAGAGARSLVLLGRGAPSAEVEPVLAALRAGGVTVLTRAVDVSDPAALAGVLAEIDASLPPLRGVVHTAGTLDDGVLLKLDRERMRTVAEPKAAGAWNLHRATLDRELDWFVLYSSAAALLGSASQGNYAAANSFADTLAHHRRQLGLPALSIDWGPWAEIGLAARPDRGGSLGARGILSLRPAEGVAALDRLLGTALTQACVLPLDREVLRAEAEGGMLPALLAGLAAPAAPGTVAGSGGRGARLRGRLLAVEPGRRRTALYLEHCREVAATVLKLDAEQIDPAAPLAGMGFDSLLSLELRKRLESSLGVSLPATLTWRFPTIEALVPFLAECMDIPLEAAPRAASPAPPPVPVARPAIPATHEPDELDESDLDALSDSELEALLLAKTKQIDEGLQR